MYIDKKGAIIKELQIEIDILKEKVWERECIINSKNSEIETLTKLINDKEEVIQRIINSRTFKIVDKIGRILRRKV